MLRALTRWAPVIIMRETPWFPVNSATCLRKNGGPSACQWPVESLLAGDTFPNTKESDLPFAARILQIFNHQVCPRGLCQTVINHRVVMFDSHHFTRSFSSTLADESREHWRRSQNLEKVNKRRAQSFCSPLGVMSLLCQSASNIDPEWSAPLMMGRLEAFK